MNKINELFSKGEGFLSVYFTAGYPKLEDTMPVLNALQKAGADFVEIGMPFSDPLADGPVIQKAGNVALDNGMTIAKLMEQLTDMRKSVSMPVILMGYINPVLHYGIERFLDDCKARGVDGLILPDLPWDEYVANYKAMFDERDIKMIPLIAPQTPDDRMRHIDEQADGFIYMVASAGITGNIKTSVDYRTLYFERVKALGLRNKRMIGFGVKDRAGFEHACSHASGAIIGTAFVNVLTENGADEKAIVDFVRSVKEG